MKPTIGIVIPTYQAARHLPSCLPPLIASPLKPKILVIDSSSSDGTIEIARSMGVETLVIPKNEFNHGLTREKGRKHLHETEITVMITQDAYPASSRMLESLVSPLLEGKASISYARQLPHSDANFLARFARHFNYPAKSHIRSLEDLSTYGVYTFFCSNSCAAYLNKALDEVGGFPSVVFGEDSIVTAKLLRKHHRIAYVAEAEVFHSHNTTLKEEFGRHYIMGISRRAHQELFGKMENQRGKAYAQAMIRELWKNSPASIPYACLHILAKFSGFHFGRLFNQQH